MTISLLLSGDGTAAGSLGGAKSAALASGVELFGQGKDMDRAAGETQYRCIYVESDVAAAAVKLFLSAGAVLVGSAIRIGWGAPLNSTALTIASKNTSPAGVTFDAPSSYAEAPSGGDFAAGDFRQLWIEYTIGAGAAQADDSFTLATDVLPSAMDFSKASNSFLLGL
jgi:hypothetical protein